MTREQKIKWIQQADTWELIKQLEHFATKHAVLNERYGCFNERTREADEDKELVKAELERRTKRG